MTDVVESNSSALPQEMPAEHRYHVEAAKRKRDDGMKQYIQLPFSDDGNKIEERLLINR